MASSSSCLKQGSVPMDNVRITPEATYEAVVADPKLFMGSLERLHSRLGTKFMVPIIGGRDLDLHKLFIEVTSRGGINKILHERRWKEVTATFVFPPTATNASYVLRKYYFSLLNNYEQIYFFRSNSHIPPDSLHTPSGAPGLMQGGTMRPPRELQALTFTPQPRITPGGVLNGANVIGVVDGKFEDGYLVTVTMGSEKLKGVLYQLVQENTVAAHQTPQQSHHSGFPSTWNNNGPYPQGVTGGVTKRRRRRKKSEIKRRDPAHPKPNRSGYNFFFAEQHARLKPLHPGKDREISRMIGELWNKLNEQERLVYQGKAMEDKERYRTEMEDYREKLRTGQLISNAVPLQQRLPEQNVEISEADVPIEEAEEEEEDEEEEEGDSSGVSGESEPHSDAEMEEPSLTTPSGLNLNPNTSEIMMAPKEKVSDVVVMETSPVKKAKEATVVVAAEQN
ncbi:High mobility group B protein 15 [Hirschfeldia incana]|nr:High mobility group B protein 15 [Hirschfeldia incana]